MKRNVKDAMSGIVINTFPTCKLQPMSDLELRESKQSRAEAKLKGLVQPTDFPLFRWESSSQISELILNVPASELVYAESPTPEDLVVYGEWVGRVEDETTMITLKLSDNGVVEISDGDADRLDDSADSFSVGDVAVTKKADLRKGNWVYGKYNPNTLPVGTVVRVRTLNAEIDWLETRIGGGDKEPPSILERKELESEKFCVYDRTRRSPGSQRLNESNTVSSSDIDVWLNLRVRFKDLSGACVKYDGSNDNGKIERIDRKDSLGYDLNVFEIVGVKTDILVQWQDLTVTRERSVDLVPETGIDDEHDAWPGEIAHPVDLEPVPGMPDVQQAKRVGIIQSVNATERMAKVKWCPEACVQYSIIDSIRSSVTGVVGIVAGEEEEFSLYELETPGELNVRRGDIVLIANGVEGTGPEDRPWNREWLGEVVDTRLDGLLTIRLGAADTVRDVNLRREDVVVAIRSDGTDAVEWDEEDFPDIRMNSDGEMEVMFSDAEGSEDMDEDDSSTYGTDSTFEEGEVRYEDEDGKPLDVSDVEDEALGI